MVKDIPKGASTEEAFKGAIKAYRHPDSQLDTAGISALDAILRPYINAPKEYDGFTAYCMIRSLAGIEEDPTQEELFKALRSGIPPEVKTKFYEKSGVKRVHVVHDLGLDSQSDDYNAVHLLMSLAK